MSWSPLGPVTKHPGTACQLQSHSREAELLEPSEDSKASGVSFSLKGPEGHPGDCYSGVSLATHKDIPTPFDQFLAPVLISVVFEERVWKFWRQTLKKA